MGYTQEEVSLTPQYTGYRYTLLKMGSWHVHRRSLNMSPLTQLLGQAKYDRDSKSQYDESNYVPVCKNFDRPPSLLGLLYLKLGTNSWLGLAKILGIVTHKTMGIDRQKGNSQAEINPPKPYKIYWRGVQKTRWSPMVHI